MKKYALLGLSIATLTLQGCNTTTQTLSNDIRTLGNTLFGNVNRDSAVAAALTPREITDAFRQALTIGSEKVVTQLGQAGGFNADPKVRIPLPSTLSKVQDALETVGASYLLDDLENKLNRAAEIATPQAKELFFNAIAEVTFDDIYNIYTGPDDSATRYFRGKMSDPLSDKFSPIVNNAISQAGAIQAFDKVMSRYQAIPFMPDVKADLTSYVVDQGIEGIFFYLAEQEKAIRQDPVRQTTELLKKVFGSSLPKS